MKRNGNEVISKTPHDAQSFSVPLYWSRDTNCQLQFTDVNSHDVRSHSPLVYCLDNSLLHSFIDSRFRLSPNRHVRALPNTANGTSNPTQQVSILLSSALGSLSTSGRRFFALPGLLVRGNRSRFRLVGCCFGVVQLLVCTHQTHESTNRYKQHDSHLSARRRIASGEQPSQQTAAPAILAAIAHPRRATGTNPLSEEPETQRRRHLSARNRTATRSAA